MLEGEVIVTDSRLVAAHFGKARYNVLRAIRDDCDDDEGAKLNFGFCTEPCAKQRGKRSPFYKVSKDGFMRLSFGFTGERSELATIRFSEAFDAVAAYMKRRERALWNQMLEIERQDNAPRWRDRSSVGEASHAHDHRQSLCAKSAYVSHIHLRRRKSCDTMLASVTLSRRHHATNDRESARRSLGGLT